jgi:Holliday junction resolvase RusA-like endonuclease
MPTYAITPCPKPRMTRADKWKKRPCVLRYREFCDQVRAAGIKLPECGASVTFFLPMPESWSEAKLEQRYGTPHQQRPDLSNLLKALEDAVYGEDSVIWSYAEVRKIWSDQGSIRVE